MATTAKSKAKRKSAPAKAKPTPRKRHERPTHLVIEKYPDGGTYAYRTANPPEPTDEPEMLDIECDLSAHDGPFTLVFSLK